MHDHISVNLSHSLTTYTTYNTHDYNEQQYKQSLSKQCFSFLSFYISIQSFILQTTYLPWLTHVHHTPQCLKIITLLCSVYMFSCVCPTNLIAPHRLVEYPCVWKSTSIYLFSLFFVFRNVSSFKCLGGSYHNHALDGHHRDYSWKIAIEPCPCWRFVPPTAPIHLVTAQMMTHTNP